jgi:hypothetical protein
VAVESTELKSELSRFKWIIVLFLVSYFIMLALTEFYHCNLNYLSKHILFLAHIQEPVFHDEIRGHLLYEILFYRLVNFNQLD